MTDTRKTTTASESLARWQPSPKTQTPATPHNGGRVIGSCSTTSKVSLLPGSMSQDGSQRAALLFVTHSHYIASLSKSQYPNSCPGQLVGLTGFANFCRRSSVHGKGEWLSAGYNSGPCVHSQLPRTQRVKQLSHSLTNCAAHFTAGLLRIICTVNVPVLPS